MLKHTCYKKYLDFMPHPTQKAFFETSTYKIYMFGGGRRAGRFFMNKLLHEIAKFNQENPREDNNNGGSPCAK